MNTNNQVSWSNSSIAERTAVVELCGWCNKAGKATPHGKKLTKTDWDKLSSASKNLLQRHGIVS